MAIDSKTSIAVLTGDLIGYTRAALESRGLAFETLHEAASVVRAWTDENWVSELARFRGDGWQFALHRPAQALRVALYFRACLRAMDIHDDIIDTRISIGIGPVERYEPRQLGASDGPAFTLSGRALDAPRTPAKIQVVFADKKPVEPAILSVAIALSDVLSARWTRKQAEVAAALLLPSPPSQREIARDFGVSAQTINQHAAAAEVDVLREACEAFEDYTNRLYCEP